MTEQEAKKQIEEHRNAGDLVDFLYDYAEENNIDAYVFSRANILSAKHFDSSLSVPDTKHLYTEGKNYAKIFLNYITEHFPFETSVIRPLLLDEEILAYDNFLSVIACCGTDREKLLTNKYLLTDEASYLINLAIQEKNSVEYNRYLKIREKIESAQILKDLDESIEKAIKSKNNTIFYRKIEKIGIISVIGIVLVLIVFFLVKGAFGKTDKNSQSSVQKTPVEKYEVKKIN